MTCRRSQIAKEEEFESLQEQVRRPAGSTSVPPLRMYVAKSTGAVPSNNNEAIGELGGALFLLIRGGGVCTPPRASPEVNENEGG